MAGLAAAASIVGTVVSAVGTIAAGQANQRAYEFQAKQYDLRAREERAAGAAQAQEYYRAARLANSTLQARAAASGFGAADPTVLDIAGDLGLRGALQAGYARYTGETRARGYSGQAEGSRMSGAAAMTGALWSAASTIVGGAASMFTRYGQFAAPAGGTDLLSGLTGNNGVVMRRSPYGYMFPGYG